MILFLQHNLTVVNQNQASKQDDQYSASITRDTATAIADRCVCECVCVWRP